MHPSVDTWVGEVVDKLGLVDVDVLELGSLDVNGTIRGRFAGRYVGIDGRRGAGVDVQAWASALPFVDEAFDCIVTTEMLEHDPTFWLTVREAYRVLRPGGAFLVTARGNRFHEHDEPFDLWRFMPDGMRRLLLDAGFTTVRVEPDPMAPGVFASAQRPR